jgi:hypothetical protein
MNENYGVKGPVHKLQQRKLWNIGLEHLPNHESFDVEFSPSGQLLQKTKYNMAGSPIGSERFLYNDSGKIIRAVELNSAGEETHISDFDYQSQENRVETTRKSSGEVVSRTIEVYEGNLLMSFTMLDGEGKLKRQKAFQYSATKLLKSDSKYYLPDGALNEQWITDYDSEGRVARTYGLNAEDKPLGDGRYRYEYDAEGRRSRLWTFDEFSGDNVASSVTVYEYETDGVGNWVERREFHQSRGDSQWSKRITTRNLTYYPIG